MDTVDLSFLIVDDEALARKSIKNMLSSLGYSTINEVDNGADALNFIIKNNPDVVFADIEMPVLDGLKLLERLKSYNLNIAVVFISGHDSFEYAQKAVSLGAYNYLLKPVHIEDLYNVITKIVEQFNFGKDVKKPQFLKDGYSVKIIENAKEYIHSNLAHDVSLITVSEYVHLTPTYFSKMFKDLSKEKFSDYVTRIRIEAAKRLLQEQNHTAKEVSILVGFNNEKYFYKVFRNYTGLTPSEYRAYVPNKNSNSE